MVNESTISVAVLVQGARALGDRELEKSLRAAGSRNERQRSWLLTRIRQGAPQTLAVAFVNQGGVQQMAKRFEIGDHVSWNSEAGRVSGTIIAIHTKDFDYKGHVRHASEDDPQYEIKSDKTDHVAAHKGSALMRKPR